MARFFVENIDNPTCVIVGDDARHISKSLRMKEGDTVILSDGKGFDSTGEILSIDENSVAVSLGEKTKNLAEPSTQIILFQALPKSDKLDFIVQKAVELGATKIVPVLTQFCVSRPKPKAMEKRVQRLNRISLEAAKQSGRGVVPVVEELIDYKTAVNRLAEMETGVILYENETKPLSELIDPKGNQIGLFVGSEGGFSEEEISYANKKGVATASLGSRILRCETAPIVALTTVLLVGKEL